jgi:hypothetical protein
MTRPPHLYRDPEAATGGDDSLRLEVAVGDGRRRFLLSDRAESMLVDDLGYEPPDVVPFATAKALVLAGGAELPDGNDERGAAWSLGGADGGRDGSDADLERLAEYLRTVEVPERSLAAVREHVRATRLSSFLDPESISDRSERVNRLRDIATDL